MFEMVIILHFTKPKPSFFTNVTNIYIFYISLTNSRQAEDGSCYFGGWARMAHPIVGFNVVEVKLTITYCFRFCC